MCRLSAIITTGCILLLSCGPSQSNQDKKLVIAVIGDGVNYDASSSASPGTRQYSINGAQGISMWQGANNAYKNLAIFNELRNYIEIKGFDDKGNENDAIQYAKNIRNNPNVIAVIGHATSGTTILPARIYRHGNIPLLMPIATSPEAGRDESDRRLNNVFRFPLNDEIGQAPAVVYLVLEHIKPRKIFLIQDVSTDAEKYSKPLTDKIRCMLGDINGLEVSPQKYNREEPTVYDLVHKISDQEIDLLIFCGYGSNANELIASLSSHYRSLKTTKIPTIILTDGCKIKTLNTGRFNTYLTFPLPSLASIGCNNNVVKLSDNLESESYELYGYDAMVVLAKVIEELRREAKEISRINIIDKLNSMQSIQGMCMAYSFKEGENTLGKYYVYSSKADSLSGNIKLIQNNAIDFADLAQILSKYGSSCSTIK